MGTNLFFLSLTGNVLLILGVTLLVTAVLLLLLFKFEQFLAVTSVCWLGAQMSMCSVLFAFFTVPEIVDYFQELRRGGFKNVL